MYPYLTLDADSSRATIEQNTTHSTVLITDIVFAFIAIVTGFFQFLDRIPLVRFLKFYMQL